MSIVICSSRFAVTKTIDGVILSADESDLQPIELQRIYPDACDVGITVRSTRTGKEMIFCLYPEPKRNIDGDVLYNDFFPVINGLARLDAGYRVRIYND